MLIIQLLHSNGVIVLKLCDLDVNKLDNRDHYYVRNIALKRELKKILFSDVHGRIKSERNGKDIEDDDITDEDRKDDILGNHMHHILNNSFGLKPELKSSDCGVPLPPSKPKIWSLADTAACKTPPPPPSQQQWLGSNFALPSSR